MATDRSIRQAFSQCGCASCLFMLRMLDTVPSDRLPEVFEVLDSMDAKSSVSFECQSMEFH